MVRNQTLLTVDDERFIHLGLNKLINWAEFNIDKIGEAFDGDAALEIIIDKRPDIILTDIRMPGLDGLDLISRVSQLEDYFPDWVIISGYESFSYAKKAMKYGVKYYLLKPIDEKELKKILIELSAKFQYNSRLDIKVERRLAVSAIIRRLVSVKAEPEYLNKAKEILGDIKPSRYCQIIFNGAYEKSVESALRTILVKLGAEGASERIVYIKDNHIGVVLTEDDVPEYELKAFVYKLQIDSSKAFNKNIYVSVGVHIDKLENLYKSFLSSKIALNKILLQKSEPVFIAEDIYEFEKIRNFDLAKEIIFFPDLLKSIECNDGEDIRVRIDCIYSWIRKHQASPSSIKLWINCLIIDITRLIVELGGNQNDYVNDFRKKALTEPFIFTEDLRKDIDLFCQNSGLIISKLKKSNCEGTISIITQYIRDNFAEQLSLKLIGERYSMNPVYLGQLFKKKTGSSFNLFLAGVRVCEAEKLLTRTDLRVYEVARSVGYFDCDYFTRQFIKIIGETPAKYRKQRLL